MVEIPTACLKRWLLYSIHCRKWSKSWAGDAHFQQAGGARTCGSRLPSKMGKTEFDYPGPILHVQDRSWFCQDRSWCCQDWSWNAGSILKWSTDPEFVRTDPANSGINRGPLCRKCVRCGYGTSFFCSRGSCQDRSCKLQRFGIWIMHFWPLGVSVEHPLFTRKKVGIGVYIQAELPVSPWFWYGSVTEGRLQLVDCLIVPPQFTNCGRLDASTWRRNCWLPLD